MTHRHALRALGATALGLLLAAVGTTPAVAAPAVAGPVERALQHERGLSPARVDELLADEAAASAAVRGWRVRLGDSYGGAWVRDDDLRSTSERSTAYRSSRLPDSPDSAHRHVRGGAQRRGSAP